MTDGFLIELGNWLTSFTCLIPKIIHTNKVALFLNEQMLICVPVFNNILILYGMPVFYSIASYQFPGIKILACMVSIPVQTKYLHINLIPVYRPALYSVNVLINFKVCFVNTYIVIV